MEFWKTLLSFLKIKESPPPEVREDPSQIECGSVSGGDGEVGVSEIPLYSRRRDTLQDDITANTPLGALGRKNHATILRAISEISQAELAERLSVAPSTVSRLKSSGELERACLILAACDIELPSESRQLYDKAFVESLQVIAAANLNKSQS